MHTHSFATRHIGPRQADMDQMLHAIGLNSIDELIYQTVPDDILLKAPLRLDGPMTEFEYATHIAQLGQRNVVAKSYIGLGYHPTYTPAVIQRNIFENPGWYTAYTPYQAEIAQGRLEAILNFQTTVIELTGMEIANASLLDEGTAAAEAMALLLDVRSREQKAAQAVRFFVDQHVLPQTWSILQTRANPIGVELVMGDPETAALDASFYGAFIQWPGATGQLIDAQSIVQRWAAQGIKTAVAADLLSLTLLTPPGEWGADVVVGTTQRFGIPMGFGGPHAAFFCTRDAYKRSVPGRIIGRTIDANGQPALRMALQTREQHIKREKATSNICTAQVLLAVMAGMYAVYHGAEGLTEIAQHIHHKTRSLHAALKAAGIAQHNTHYFDTLHLALPAQQVRNLAEAEHINFYYPNEEAVVVALNETTTWTDVAQIARILMAAKGLTTQAEMTKAPQGYAWPEAWQRSSTFLQHEVFKAYRSESQLMRYIKKLERRDMSLTHSMISLGSCTMKLNAAAEMLPLSMPQWSNIHPFAPAYQVEGYTQMLRKLEDQLTEITGFAGTTLQPNSGAQGEYAGLMTIRAYHMARGDHHRKVCLIPASAHGTNPASAAMAGMTIVVTKTMDNGNIDVEDLREKALLHADNLSCLMVTYPSTHGVYESAIREITQIIHDCGGLVYMDGANMNAQVGLTNPATIGADVCHLNLHKTFAIPHGGGGPGVGPICVNEKLLPFLPGHPLRQVGGDQAITAISAAPYGSALVCLISYGYICMLGAEGLKQATQMAILNANYIKERLADHYPILYTGECGRAAHELILDCRAFKTKGIEVTDIAKRLMDYGFHAPTVSFPVAGTLMVEPTESEDLAELDRFCDAMVAIRAEIEAAEVEQPNNPLKNAPHTLAMVAADHWDFPYSRSQAGFPLAYTEDNKFWPAVRRVDDAYGDRNLVCSCAPIEAYSEA